MRLGFLTSIPLTIEAFFLDWIAAWKSEGWSVHAAAGGSPNQPLPSDSYTTIPGLGQRPGPGLYRAAQALRDWRDRYDFDLVVTNTATASALYRLIGPGREKLVYFCHGLHFSDSPSSPSEKAFRSLESALADRCDAAICMNSIDHEFFKDRLEEKQVLRLRTGVGLPSGEWAAVRDARASRSRNSAQSNLLWVGSFTERKRPLDAIAVADRLVDLMPIPLRLHMLGDGPMVDHCSQLVRRLGRSDSIALPGRVDPKPYMEQADLLLHTARWEGFCRTLMEATYVGLPAVSYDAKGCRDVPETIVQGTPGDLEALVSKSLERLMDGGERGRPATPDLSWVHPFGETTEFLERIAA